MPRPVLLALSLGLMLASPPVLAQQVDLEELERQLEAMEAEQAAQERRAAAEARRRAEAAAAEERRRQEAAAAEERRQEEVARLGGFEEAGNGSLRDTRTGLLWTQSDNGSRVDWHQAQAHCQSKGMRLPTIEELAAIYNRPGAGTTSCGSATCRVSPLFRLTSLWSWSGTLEGSSRAWYFDFNAGHRNTSTPDSYSRALCVGGS